jgi:sugar phosphate isomerase/epimerase
VNEREPLRRRLSISQVSTSPWTFDQDAEAYAAAGVDGIGVWRGKLDRYGNEEGARLVADLGLPVANLVGEIPLAGRFDHVDGAVLDLAREVMDLAQSLGTEIIHVAPWLARGREPELMRRLTLDTIGELLPELEQRGLVFALEPIRAPWVDYLNTLGEAFDLVASVDSPHVGVLLDTWHVWDDPALFELIERQGRRIASVQFSDTRRETRYEHDREVPGRGIADLDAMFTALDRAGYRGWYDLELFSFEHWGGDVEQIIVETLQWFDERRAIAPVDRPEP